MRVLVTGAGGQLGHDLVDAFAGHEVAGLSRRDLDITDEAAVAGAVAELRPALVVNAAAWTDVDGCEADPDRAHAVNALGPWWLARACERAGAVLVQVSTDHVFGGMLPRGPGDRPRALTEFDPVAPVNAYGRSKAAGEALVRQTLREHHIVRTAWLAGARGGGFVTAVLRAARERGRIEVVDDQHGCPTVTRDLAVAIREVAVSGRYGTWHRANSGQATRYELATAALELAGVDAEVVPVSSEALDRPAPRPAWAVLDQAHATAAGLTPLPHWRDGLARLVEELGEAVAPPGGAA